MKDGNPYLGPRAYERADRDFFYGRNRESRDLLSLILSERVVIFYAPSGAGKTSLLNAQIIPALERENFWVFPVARVGGETWSGLKSNSNENPFVFNALVSFSGGKVDPEELQSQTLLTFLAAHSPEPTEDSFMGNPAPLVIFDPFEEIFATGDDPLAWVEGFFLQMAEAMQALPDLGVVFVLREDYLAQMDPFSGLFENRLRARYRMERLDADGALEAIQKPAQKMGWTFDTGVAEQLVNDLRRVRVQRPSGAAEDHKTLGPYVEPVQLQVVCYRLWEDLPDRKARLIQLDDVLQYGNQDRALSDFYEEALECAQRETGTSEGVLRRWCGHTLITAERRRGLVLHEPKTTAGLPNAAVEVLERRKLIRSSVRAGMEWYELIHDRLIEPILSSNQGWEMRLQTPLRTTARQWSLSRRAALLYRGETLGVAMEWARRHPNELESYEKEFLNASYRAEQSRISQRERLTFLSAAPLFQGLGPEELRHVVAISEAVSFLEGERILAQGGEGYAMYIIVRGKVAVQRQSDDKPEKVVPLVTLGVSECFGEMSFFDGEPYSADVIALEATDTLILRREPLLALIKRYPQIALDVIKVFSQRLRQANDRLVQL